MDKTDPMRIPDRAGVAYEVHDCAATGAVSGAEVAGAMGQGPACASKTLVANSAPGRHLVFAVPVAGELDLEKAAAAVGGGRPSR